MNRIYSTTMLFAVSFWLSMATTVYGQFGGAAQAVWKSNGTILYTDPSNTKVAIGTEAPTAPLEISGNGLLLFLNQASAGSGPSYGSAYLKILPNHTVSAWTIGAHGTGGGMDNDFWIGQSNDLSDAKLMIDNSSGNIGIGTTTPAARLHLFEKGSGGTTTLQLEYEYTGTPNGQQNADWQLQAASLGGKFHIAAGGQSQLTIDSGGNVGIGTTNPGAYKLAVNGSVRAKEVVVETGWSDFVFDDDYRLMPLEEVKQHIQAHGHLPGIPSAEQVAANGVSLGEMQAKLLQKIEELTLYVIEQDKQINRMQKELEEMKNENVVLRNRLEN